MSIDISSTLEPDSDQLDAVDLLGGARVFTIKDVTEGNREQPVNVHLVEFPRPWRPGKSMRRVLAACWTSDASQWIGRRVELYCDENVKFGGEAVGGTRISALSHIDKVRKIPLLVSRGKTAAFIVKPLKDAPAPASARDWVAEIGLAEDADSLRALWRAADESGQLTDELKELITERVEAVKEEVES